MTTYYIQYHQASRRDLGMDNQICTCFLLSHLARGGWPTSQAKLNLLSKVVQDSATSSISSYSPYKRECRHRRGVGAAVE